VFSLLSTSDYRRNFLMSEWAAAVICKYEELNSIRMRKSEILKATAFKRVQNQILTKTSCLKRSSTDLLSLSYSVKRTLSCRFGKRALMFCHNA